jgi:hypothetical protein
MTTERGWYPDPSNEHTMRFWTGTQWMGERVWDGDAWVDQVDPAINARPSAAAAVEIAAPATPKLTAVAVRSALSPTAWLVFGGAAVAALASFLPWVQATGPYGNTVSAAPQGGGPVFLMCLCAVVVWIAWPTRVGNLSMRRRVGVSVLVVVLSIFVFSNFGDLGTLQRQNPGANINGGAGLYLYTAGVVALWIGVVRTWLTDRRRTDVTVHDGQ